MCHHAQSLVREKWGVAVATLCGHYQPSGLVCKSQKLYPGPLHSLDKEEKGHLIPAQSNGYDFSFYSD